MMDAFGISDPGLLRENNEDYYLIRQDRGLYVVADGMGGAQAGEHASRLAVETVAECISDNDHPDATALSEAFQEANRRVMAAAANDMDMEGMGTTLVAALENGTNVFIASVGDSRAYLYEGKHLRAITDDQTWVNEVGRRLGMDETSLKNHPMKHVLTMAIGVSGDLRIHSYTVKQNPGTQILLCSDGLHGVVDSEVLSDALATNGSLESKVKKMVTAAKANGAPDNVTAILLQCK
jgi:protein phosphatase